MNNLNLTKRIAKLGEPFLVNVKSEPLNNPFWLHANLDLANRLNIDNFANDSWLKTINGEIAINNYPATASLYAGHQFGSFVAKLGDGRAILIAEHKDNVGKIWELQTKGSGKTPFSRMGDGRAVLRSTIREYLCSNMMYHLNIPTTEALAIIGSTDVVYREEKESAAVILRVAQSFIRFGHFEAYANYNMQRELQILLDFVISNYYPQINETNKYLAFFKLVVKNTAKLIAKWQAVGFYHGVMNTDNMSILGLTLDYGPFGFMDNFSFNYMCNHSDYEGRYNYSNQPYIGMWNLNVLANTLTSLVAKNDLINALEEYKTLFSDYYFEEFGKKLGFIDFNSNDSSLLAELLNILDKSKTDWTIFWRKLSLIDENDIKSQIDVINEVYDKENFRLWLDKYLLLISVRNPDRYSRKKIMQYANPKYILRNYMLQNAIEKAKNNDFTEVANLFKITSSPYEELMEYHHYAMPAPSWAKEINLSCSS